MSKGSSASDRQYAITTPSPRSNVLWVDGAVPLEKYLELKSYQVRERR